MSKYARDGAREAIDVAPAELITADAPTCVHCCWVWDNGVCRIKSLNRICYVHGMVPTGTSPATGRAPAHVELPGYGELAGH